MMSSRVFRVMLGLVLAAVVTTAASAGASKEAGETQTVNATRAAGSAFGEAPMLAAMVANGTLPPVEQRLPDEPYVSKLNPAIGISSIGTYGGRIRTVRATPERDAETDLLNFEPLLNQPEFQGNGIGNVVKDFVANDSYTVFTISLRPGMKWSDGVAVTTEDVRFVWEDIIHNDKLTPVFPAFLKVGDEQPSLNVVDKYTFTLTYPKPNGGLFQAFSYYMRSYDDLLAPAHYLKQYHVKYTSLETLEPLIEEGGFAEGEWWSLFTHMSDGDAVVGVPSLEPWILSSIDMGTIKFTRNPYYWKVDEQGNQLPYVDTLESALVQDAEIIALKIAAGEVDFCLEKTVLDKMPFYKENEVRGGYTVRLYNANFAFQFMLNMSHPDPVYSSVVGDLRFRKAVNLAVNFDEINDAIHLGIASPNLEVPNEYDPARAKQLLDEMGMNKFDSDGYRLAPDGSRFSIHMDICQLMGFEGNTAELVIEYLNSIGIRSEMKLVEFGAWDALGNSNQIYSSIHWNLSPTWRALPVAYGDFIPDAYRSWGAGYRTWYDTDGAEGVEPPADVKRLFELRDIVFTTTSEKERADAIEEVIRLYQTNLYWIGLGWPAKPVVFANGIANYPSDNVTDSSLGFMNFDHYYYK